VDGHALPREGLQRLEQLARALKTLLDTDRERLVDHPRELRRHPRRAVQHRGRAFGADGDDQLADRVDVVEGRDAAEDLVKDDAERPEVRAVIHVSRAAGLLGRHVQRRADQASSARQGADLLHVLGHDLGDAEIHELHHALAVVALGEEEVRRLDIAMHDPGGVRLLQPSASLRHDARRELRREWAEAIEDFTDILAVQELHHEEGRAALDPDVEDLRDVLGLDLARRSRLDLKALEELRVGRVLGRDDLDGDAPPGPRVASLEDGPHSSLPKEAGHGVLSRENLADHVLSLTVSDRCARRNQP
jgi:hypothetical protein